MNKHQRYAAAKRLLERQALSSAAYEKAVRALARRYGI